jgi:hypothetical protein
VVAAPGVVLEEGQVLASRGVLKRRVLLLSASLTPPALESGARSVGWPDRRELCAQIKAALTVLSEARYARSEAPAAADLDAALDRVRAALQRARMLSAWPVRALGRVSSWWHSRRGPAWAR